MSIINRKTVLEDLSAELFFEIFDYFHFIELYNTFSNLNRRIDGYLDHLSSTYLYFSKRVDFTTTKLNEKQSLCVRSIKNRWWTWEMDDRHVIQEFFIQYPLKSFRELCSLKLWSINSVTDFPIIIDQLPLLPHLTFLDIDFDLYESKITIDELRHTYETIFRNCVSLKRLKVVIYDNLDSRKRIRKEALFTWPIVTQIEHLNFYQLYMEELDCILSPLSLPQVKSLNVTIYYNRRQMYFSSEGLTLDFLTNFRLNFDCGFQFTSLQSILKRTPNLKTFVITSSGSIGLIDCTKWQYLLSKYLLKVAKLHLHAYDWCENQWFKRNEYLDFQTSTYWLEERGGAVQTECKQVLDEEGSEIDSISVTFRTTEFKNWEIKCTCCLRYK